MMFLVIRVEHYSDIYDNKISVAIKDLKFDTQFVIN